MCVWFFRFVSLVCMFGSIQCWCPSSNGVCACTGECGSDSTYGSGAITCTIDGVLPSLQPGDRNGQGTCHWETVNLIINSIPVFDSTIFKPGFATVNLNIHQNSTDPISFATQPIMSNLNKDSRVSVTVTSLSGQLPFGAFDTDQDIWLSFAGSFTIDKPLPRWKYPSSLERLILNSSVYSDLPSNVFENLQCQEYTIDIYNFTVIKSNMFNSIASLQLCNVERIESFAVNNSIIEWLFVNRGSDYGVPACTKEASVSVVEAHAFHNTKVDSMYITVSADSEIHDQYFDTQSIADKASLDLKIMVETNTIRRDNIGNLTMYFSYLDVAVKSLSGQIPFAAFDTDTDQYIYLSFEGSFTIDEPLSLWKYPDSLKSLILNSSVYSDLPSNVFQNLQCKDYSIDIFDFTVIKSNMFNNIERLQFCNVERIESYAVNNSNMNWLYVNTDFLVPCTTEASVSVIEAHAFHNTMVDTGMFITVSADSEIHDQCFDTQSIGNDRQLNLKIMVGTTNIIRYDSIGNLTKYFKYLDVAVKSLSGPLPFAAFDTDQYIVLSFEGSFTIDKPLPLWKYPSSLRGLTLKSSVYSDLPSNVFENLQCQTYFIDIYNLTIMKSNMFNNIDWLTFCNVERIESFAVINSNINLLYVNTGSCTKEASVSVIEAHAFHNTQFHKDHGVWITVSADIEIHEQYFDSSSGDDAPLILDIMIETNNTIRCDSIGHLTKYLNVWRTTIETSTPGLSISGAVCGDENNPKQLDISYDNNCPEAECMAKLNKISSFPLVTQLRLSALDESNIDINLTAHFPNLSQLKIKNVCEHSLLTLPSPSTIDLESYQYMDPLRLVFRANHLSYLNLKNILHSTQPIECSCSISWMIQLRDCHTNKSDTSVDEYLSNVQCANKIGTVMEYLLTETCCEYTTKKPTPIPNCNGYHTLPASVLTFDHGDLPQCKSNKEWRFDPCDVQMFYDNPLATRQPPTTSTSPGSTYSASASTALTPVFGTASIAQSTAPTTSTTAPTTSINTN